jgi:glyoxylase-like metal-dependent hydrolase (beta-lactamase superfamily II)
MLHLEYFTFNNFQTRCTLIWDDQGYCAFVDPGFSTPEERDALTETISRHNLKPVCIMLTHGHFDHILGVAELAAMYAPEGSEGALPVYMHPDEKYTLENNSFFVRAFGAPMPADFETTDIAEGDTIEVGSLRFEVISTPGHSAGGVCYYERAEKVLLSGDTLFAGAIGRSDHPGGDYDRLMKSILEKIVTLDGDVTVIPGHGPCTDIATEGMTNPFLLPFNEPYEE